MYYVIETCASGWAVSCGGRRLDTFRTHAEAAAFIKGRRSAEGRAS
jgi:hypothetical protein